MADYKRGDTASWDKEQVRQSERSRQSAQQTGRKRRRRPAGEPTAICTVCGALLGDSGRSWLAAGLGPVRL